MAKVYTFLADGFEEIEGLTVVDLLRRAGIDTTMISISDTVEIYGGHGIVVTADKVFDEVSFDDVDMLVLPGGKVGVQNIGKHKELLNRIEEFVSDGKMVAAVCAAPSILGELELLKGRRATCYPGWEEHLHGAFTVTDSVVIDENIITSRGLGTSIDFALAIIRHFKGEEEAVNIANSIVYKK